MDSLGVVVEDDALMRHCWMILGLSKCNVLTFGKQMKNEQALVVLQSITRSPGYLSTGRFPEMSTLDSFGKSRLGLATSKYRQNGLPETTLSRSLGSWRSCMIQKQSSAYSFLNNSPTLSLARSSFKMHRTTVDLVF